eukprot:4567328-Amphidinium_carterae.1
MRRTGQNGAWENTRAVDPQAGLLWQERVHFPHSIPSNPQACACSFFKQQSEQIKRKDEQNQFATLRP